MRELIKDLGLKILNYGNDKEINGCYVGDILSYALAKLKIGDIWITTQKNINVTAIAHTKKAACVILAESVMMDSDALAKASEKDVNVFSSDLTAFELAVLISRIVKINGGKE